MILKTQLTGMRGVYLVAAELSRLGFIASPTSRSARGADILATDQKCKHAYSIQVKTNTTTFSFWLLNKEAKELKSRSHFYAFVNLRPNGEIEYYIVPSSVVADKAKIEKSRKGSIWYSFSLQNAKKYKDKWSVLGPSQKDYFCDVGRGEGRRVSTRTGERSLNFFDIQKGF